jgi:PAS domain S-box-containing protein
MTMMSLSLSAAPDVAELAGQFDALPKSVVVTEPGLSGSYQRILYVNPAFEAMTGWSRAEAVGRTPSLLQGPETDHTIFRDLQARLVRGEGWQGETVNYRRDGSPFVMAWSISPIKSADGSVSAFLAIQDDVTERRRLERAVEESEQRYRALFDQSFQLATVLAPDGTVLAVNQTALHFGDVRRADAIGRPYWDTPWWQVSEASRARLREAVASAAAGTFVQFRAQCRGRHGEPHTLDVSIKPVRDESGGIVLLMHEARDVSQLVEQKQRLKRETARLSQAQRIGRMGGWDFDIATQTFQNHDECRELFGLPSDFARTSRAAFETIVHPDDLADQREALDRACRTGERYDATFRITTPGGAYVVNAVGEPIRDRTGAVQGLAGIVQDITERHRFEQELIAARKEAEAASEAKSKFLATMGHELRTPLNAINGFSEIMAAEAFGPLGTPAYRDYATHILDSGQHLLQLINDVLDVTRLQMNTLEVHPERFDVKDFVRRTAEQFGPTAQQAGVTVVAERVQADVLTADQRLLRQLLSNLIGNAIKFSPPSTTVEVVGEGTEDGGYALRIRDEGPGIPEEARQRLLQAFQQGDDTLARRHDGLGLGLYIARGIAEAHGGHLDIGTAPGGGAEMTAYLPALCRAAHVSGGACERAAGENADLSATGV